MKTSPDKDDLEIAHLDHMQTTFSDDEKKRIVRRVDGYLVTMCGLTACVSLMDRTNISSAAIAGMNEALDLNVENRYSIVVLVFFITYVVG